MKSALYTLAGAATTALAATHGFNYGSQGNTQSTFETQFTIAQELAGTSGWGSARLYTMVQDGTANTVISAIPAAIATNTTLLLGLWASENQAAFNNELTALKNAISQYGTSFSNLVTGISVGSEDLYRDSPTGIAANSGYGQSPDVIADYIGQVRSAIAGTVLSSKPVGHVDTWNTYTNSSNAAVIAAADFLGLDEYPFYETTNVNDISNASYLFFSAYNKVEAVAQGKPIWITETGWPVSGASEGLAVPSVDNAETYWKAVACELLQRNIPTWWYILNDNGASPSFGVTTGTTPLYDLSCPSVASSSAAVVPSSSVASATMPSTAATSTTIPVTAAHPASNYVSSSVSSGALSQASSAVLAVASSVSSRVSSASSVAATGVAASSAVQSSAAQSSAAQSSVAKSSVVGSSVVASSVAAPVTTSTATVQGASTHTVYSTTLITITSCGDTVTECPASSLSTVVSASSVPAAVASSAKQSASSVLTSAPLSVTSAAASTVTPTGAAAATGCPADINGAYQYPHLIVPIDSSSPKKAYGTSYNGTITPTISTIFNFDIPASYANKTCSTVFLFPELSQLETSSYSFNGKGGFNIALLNGVADESTTYASAPAVTKKVGSVDQLEAGNSYTLSMDSCPAGARVSFEVTSMGGLDLEFFEDYNPSPLGLYVRAC